MTTIDETPTGSTDPDVPLRMELGFDLPGTPEQVWDAIATGNGISAWMLPTDLEEREGGAVCFHMGETDSAGTVTTWDPPRRLVYEEPGWAALGGHEGAPVTPLVSEFVVEPLAGGGCALRVVSSAFGTGADWERTFIADMERAWTPSFDTLRILLTHFPGQRATSLSTDLATTATPATAVSAMRRALGADDVGDRLDIRGTAAVVERVGADQVLLRLTDPVPGLLTLFAFDTGEGTTLCRVEGALFSDEGPAYVEREQPVWKAWLEDIASGRDGGRR